MHGSMRFFCDKAPDSIQGQQILNVFELFSNVLGTDYELFSYILWSPDEDDDFINVSYNNTPMGKERFLNERIIPLIKGKDGDLSAPIISATCKCKESQIYSDIRVQIRFPVYSMPFTICADFEEDIVNKVKYKEYIKLICGLQKMGYSINNGLYHVYCMKNEAETLDGGQIGSIISCCGRKNINQCIKHRKKGGLDCLMGIYYYNTIRNDLLDDTTRNRISEIIGNNDHDILDNTFSFALTACDHVSSSYWIKNYQKIKTLEKELCRFT